MLGWSNANLHALQKTPLVTPPFLQSTKESTTMRAIRSTAVLPLLGLAFACSPDTMEPTRLSPEAQAPFAAVYPAYRYTPTVYPPQGWFSDVNGKNLVVGMGDGRAIAVQMGGPLVNLSNGPGNWARAEAVNNRGEIVGNVDLGPLGSPRYTPAYWANTSATPVLLPYPGEARDINDTGFVVGTITTRRGLNTAFGWDPNTGNLDVLRPLPGHRESSAAAINNDYVVLGYSDGVTPVLWQRSGGIWVPRQITGGIEPYDLDSGYGVVGSTGQLASFGKPDHVGFFSTVGPSFATAVTGRGVAAGYDSGVPAPGGWMNSMTAFVADQSGTTTYLPYLTTGGPWKASLAFGLNECGVVVGQFWTQAGAQPVIWDPGC